MDLQFEWLVCPKIQKIVEELKVVAMHCEVTYAGNFTYEVRVGIKTFIVDLDRHMCTCRKWNLTGIPCPHTIGAILTDKRQPEAFVNLFYHRETYIRCYASIVNPIPDQSMWVVTEFDAIMPPPLRRPAGRPKKVRRQLMSLRNHTWLKRHTSRVWQL